MDGFTEEYYKITTPNAGVLSNVMPISSMVIQTSSSFAHVLEVKVCKTGN